jgi:ribosomal protein S18 acetylase RimI-like enzyme
MDRGDLARLEHRNMIETLVMTGGQAQGARILRADGVALIATGLPLRLFNQVLVEDDGARPEAIARAVSVTRERDDPFVVNLRVGADDRYRPLMAGLGLVPLSVAPWMPGMAMHPLPKPGTRQPASGHEIRRATDASGLTDHIQTAAAGFGMPVAWVEAVMGETLLARSDAAVYVGYSDGVPVTSGLGVRTGRTIGIYNIATVESARRQGHGAAMTMRIIDDGAADGVDVAILQSSDMGFRMYQGIGFHTVVEYSGFVDPASLDPGSAADPS